MALKQEEIAKLQDHIEEHRLVNDSLVLQVENLKTRLEDDQIRFNQDQLEQEQLKKEQIEQMRLLQEQLELHKPVYYVIPCIDQKIAKGAAQVARGTSGS